MRLIFPILLLLSLSYGQHFVPAYLEYGGSYFAMNITVTSAMLGDETLVTGDEIGVFEELKKKLFFLSGQNLKLN